jgi:ABC-type multidrug transport system permease subunit
MVLAQARMETRLLLRNGEQLLLAVVIPLIVLVGGINAAKHFDLSFSHSAVDTLTPGILALAIMSTSFTSLAIATGFERRYGVLKRLGSSPLPRSGLLAGKVGALLVVEVLQFVVIGGAAVLLGWSPALSAAGVLGALACALLGTAAFASLGLLVAGALRAEATLASSCWPAAPWCSPPGPTERPAASSRCCRRVRSGRACGPPSSTPPSRSGRCWCCSCGRSSARRSPRAPSAGSESRGS